MELLSAAERGDPESHALVSERDGTSAAPSRCSVLMDFIKKGEFRISTETEWRCSSFAVSYKAQLHRMRLPTYLAAIAILAACHVADRPPDKGVQSMAASLASPFRVPSDSEIVDAEIIRSVRRGRAVLRNTRDSLPGHVGNQLACISCHAADGTDRKSTRLNSSHRTISYAGFCLKKKKRIA